ncbi:hypothetical protein GOP47_0008473 [Adiantum capillus-veneris]|uniref:Integral membrane protein n=1 Tax=Adiantum capillus-veneris TaxID=13818 RepID=A0A9D4UYN1_ADICA|nr:hypothetical protein GOP47_0008473 [Adiantum capillus-veneris]
MASAPLLPRTDCRFSEALQRLRGQSLCAVRFSNGSLSCSRGDSGGLRIRYRSVSLQKAFHSPRAALNDSSSPPTEVFQGVYGPWSIDSNDVQEVLLYRAGLVTAAVTFVLSASRAYLPEDSILSSFIDQSTDALYAIGTGGLGVALFLIHIYVTPIKRTLQLLWAAGALGSIVVAAKFAAPQGEGLVNFVLENRWAIWLVGPLFASLTGLVFKEGLCYGKLEAALLFFVIPAVLLGHLSGLADARVELALLFAWISLFTVFTARKFSQPIKDDLGDKSIFMFNALSEEEKQRFLSKLEGGTLDRETE